MSTERETIAHPDVAGKPVDIAHELQELNDTEKLDSSNEQAHIIEFLSQVAISTHIGVGVKSPRQRIIEQAQEAGKPISNMTGVTKYKKARQMFMIEKAKKGDDFALEQLCINSVGLILGRVRHYLGTLEEDDVIGEMSVETDDLTQVSLLEVPKVVRRFSEKEGVTFASFLSQRVSFALIDYGRAVATTMGLNRFNYRDLKKALESDTPQENIQLLVQNGFARAPQYVKDGQISVGSISLDELIANSAIPEVEQDYETEDDDYTNVLPELIDVTDIENTVVNSASNNELGEYVNDLPEAQRSVVVRYYGLFGVESLTLAEIGEKEGFTESMASKINSTGLSNLRKLMNGEQLHLTPQRRAGLVNLPMTWSKSRLIKQADKILSTRSDRRLFNEDVADALQIAAEWEAAHTYSGIEKITTLKRELPATLSVDDLLSQVPESERRSISHKKDVLSLEVRDITGEDLQVLLHIESFLMKAITPPETQELKDMLSLKEQKILGSIFKPNQEVALGMGISHSTIRTHIHNIMNKFGFTSAINLAVFAARNGLISLDTIPEDRTTENLSKAERRLVQGFYSATYKDAAEALGLATTTVRTTWHNIYSKTQSFNRIQVSLIAIRDGLIPLEEESISKSEKV